MLAATLVPAPTHAPAPVPVPAWLYPKPAAEPPKLGEILDNMGYDQRLFHHTFATQNDDVHFLEYRILHRLNIFHIQNRLAKLKGSCWKDKKASEADLSELKTTLHDYSKCLPCEVDSGRFGPASDNMMSSFERRFQ
jgi:hypothetical protein